MKRSTKLLIVLFLIIAYILRFFSSESMNQQTVLYINYLGTGIFTFLIAVMVIDAFRKK